MRYVALRQSSGQPLWVAVFTLVVATGLAPAPAATSRATEPELRDGSSEPLQQYRAFRRMHAQSEKSSYEGWLDAWTEFDSKGFRYHIVSERGSDAVRNKVLKALLKREQELIAEGSAAGGELTETNYEFGEETLKNGLRYLLIKPKRKDVNLVDGRIVFDDAGELLRVEGVLAKNPSFWTTQVNVTRHYARVDGVRVPVATESVAKVRFVGRSRLDVRYEYESINHRPVGTAAALRGIRGSASARR